MLISVLPAALSQALPSPISPWSRVTLVPCHPGPITAPSHSPSCRPHPTPAAIWDGESGLSASSRGGVFVLGEGWLQQGEKIANKKHLIDFFNLFFFFQTNGRGALGNRRHLRPVSGLCWSLLRDRGDCGHRAGGQNDTWDLGSVCWGNGENGESSFYQLCEARPFSWGLRRRVLVSPQIRRRRDSMKGKGGMGTAGAEEGEQAP